MIPQSACTVLCCNCGVPIVGAAGLVMCQDCIRLTTDISTGIPREATIHFCRNCERFLQPPSQWIAAQPESRELLALCLRRLKGLGKVRLVDAKFIWTEPHSRRIKVKLTIQGEAAQNTIVQQSFEVEYVVNACQCPDCARSFTVNTWKAVVQLRQKVPHKRTFFYLEQLILKHSAHLDTVSIKENRDGLDFYYATPNHAVNMLSFLSAVAPVKYKRSEELISIDTHSATKNYKFSYSVEIVPICRDDLVVLPADVANALHNISPVVLCNKVSNTLQFLDPNTLQTAELTAPVYWRTPFASLADSSQLVEFIVLNVEPLGPMRGKFALADIEVARASDISRNTQTYQLRTHLGALLRPGDSVLGYYLVNSNFNSREFDSLRVGVAPDVVLVKKHYPGKRKNRGRNWKLKRMAKEHNIEDDARVSKNDLDRVERDYEMFLQELEEDRELRGNVNLYKSNQNNLPRNPNSMDDDEDEDEDEGKYDTNAPQVGLDELLDDLGDLNLQD
ncbi:uncharacterized protein SAPINGB_P000510 [Magnusiomyces paraingens]|uniref:60S ribosomal export protein NMD3 n=1 Tax=Magnusiomyces paraingens TaxID=2606893 RepID=A0A5E8B1R5_9ASCO|nr:uncharacterized protein SAPINGB_P000510 [Saprochaete ingens]VVT44720.1 unnamed protein product [Saprochaete ingens]